MFGRRLTPLAALPARVGQARSQAGHAAGAEAALRRAERLRPGDAGPLLQLVELHRAADRPALVAKCG